ncbi:NUDIX hydrolase [Catenovulum sp. 2E275]|uniref:NUDIX hydrolase n=1 Tax=Catenovulum sp. 2E275 TaxID=2980497 RepID=UPI0021D2ED05|nr:NUDIX hydrolase [Catenovulum sp. 2E275]MCU4674554.1 NUDIX hydrolase [Catenovulum sp. 2E275]
MFKPNTTVACIVKCNHHFLLVEETEDGRQVYNQPAGHLEQNESLLDAAKRELYEETGLKLEPQALVGIYQSEVKHKNIQYLRFCYLIELEQNELPKTQPQDSDITAAHWFTLEQIDQKLSQMRSPLVKICLDDYLAGKRIPLSGVQSYL